MSQAIPPVCRRSLAAGEANRPCVGEDLPLSSTLLLLDQRDGDDPALADAVRRPHSAGSRSAGGGVCGALASGVFPGAGPTWSRDAPAVRASAVQRCRAVRAAVPDVRDDDRLGQRRPGRWTAALRAHVGGTLLCLLDAAAVPWLLLSAMRGRWLGGAVPGIAGPWIAVLVALVTLVEWIWRLYSA